MREIRNVAARDGLPLSSEYRAATQQKAGPEKKPKKAPAPFSIRFSVEERALLDRSAAGMPLAAYIRQKLFDGELKQPRRRGRHPVKDHAELARVLAALGASRLSSNLNQIAKAAHLGALPVTPELEDELGEACRDIRSMREGLMKALGFPDAEGPS